MSFQKWDVNLESLLEMMVSGSPCSLTISLTNSHASSEALVVVHMGIRCTMDVSLQIMTHK